MGGIEDKLKTHIVYGNGESRPREPLSGNFTSWGCNAIYRDFIVDNLVVIDYPMQQEVYKSDYPMKNKCWFADWEVLPADFIPDAIIEGWDDPIYETSKKGRRSCVVQGKTKETVEVAGEETGDEVEAIQAESSEDDHQNVDVSHHNSHNSVNSYAASPW